jgi:DNA-binding CsgD family transcriptional regulator
MNSYTTLLTDRERQVAQLLSKGHTYQTIAEQLCVSHETVKMHLKNIYRKLDAGNKIEALHKLKLL